MTTQRELNSECKRLAEALKQRNLKIVFAESCTGGLVSAALARIPGISEYHCGSAVVYRLETKTEWLGISRNTLDRHDPVSTHIAEEMARRVLEKTPEANLSAAVTGHLGPNAPANQDGLVCVSVAQRILGQQGGSIRVSVKEFRLPAEKMGCKPERGRTLRLRRQYEAARLVVSAARDCIVALPQQ